MTMMSSPFLAHTAWLCIAYGAAFCAICPRADSLLSTNVRSAESQLVARHFGLALLLVGHLCLAGPGPGPGAVPDEARLTRAVLAWHGAVVAAFAVEFGWIGAFRDAPPLTRALARSGPLAHALLLAEGLAGRSGWTGWTASVDDVCGGWSPLAAARGVFQVANATTTQYAALFVEKCTARTVSTFIFAAIAAVWLACRQISQNRRRRSSIDDLNGDLVVITGAGGGIGREIALSFAKQGARLALWDVREEALEDAAGWLTSRGVRPGDVQTSVVDVSDANAVAAAAESLKKSRGGRAPRVVVSNAAVMRGKTLLDSSDDEIRLDFSVNVLAAFWVHRTFLRQMSEGVLVTMGSIMADLPAARMTEYCASKAALTQLHECLRWELKQANSGRPDNDVPGVRTLLVQPYAVKTPMVSGTAILGEGPTAAHRRLALLRGILPPLEPAAVAQRIVEAVLRGEERVYIPRHVGWICLILNTLPGFITDILLSFIGAIDGAEGFVGCAPVR